MAYRVPTTDEARLLRFIGAAATVPLPPDWMDGLLVEDMSDGGMGSLRLLPQGAGDTMNRFRHAGTSACKFKDEDGVEVIVTLNVNELGVPFELDVWKVDFSPVHNIPHEFEVFDDNAPSQ